MFRRDIIEIISLPFGVIEMLRFYQEDKSFGFNDSHILRKDFHSFRQGTCCIRNHILSPSVIRDEFQRINYFYFGAFVAFLQSYICGQKIIAFRVDCTGNMNRLNHKAPALLFPAHRVLPGFQAGHETNSDHHTAC